MGFRFKSATLKLCLILVCIILMTQATYAQQLKSNYTLYDYNDRVKSILTTQGHSPGDFFQIRSLYSLLDFYDPDGAPIIEKLKALAPQIIPASQDTENLKKFTQFQQLTLQHIGNLNVVNALIEISDLYPDLINKKQINYIRTGLLSSLTVGGNGRSFSTAYALFTQGEEAALIERLGITPLFTSIAEQSPQHYLIIKTILPGTQNETLVYIRNTPAAKALAKREKERKDTPIIGR